MYYNVYTGALAHIDVPTDKILADARVLSPAIKCAPPPAPWSVQFITPPRFYVIYTPTILNRYHLNRTYPGFLKRLTAFSNDLYRPTPRRFTL